jgi:flagellar biosynthesis protein FlhB
MAEEQAQEKTEQPSLKRLKEAREKGQVGALERFECHFDFIVLWRCPLYFLVIICPRSLC